MHVLVIPQETADLIEGKLLQQFVSTIAARAGDSCRQTTRPLCETGLFTFAQPMAKLLSCRSGAGIIASSRIVGPDVAALVCTQHYCHAGL